MSAIVDREAFLAERRKGIGGSDVGAILGVDPRKTAYQLWREKVGLPDAPGGKQAAMRRGNFMEPAILRRYAELVQPAKLETAIPHEADGGWRRGNQDARATMADGGRRVVEAKSINRYVHRSEWGQPWTDEVPDRALCQGLWYGNLDDADVVDFAVVVMPDDPDEVLGLSPDEVLAISEFHIYQAARRPKLEQIVVERARTFWHDHVLGRVEPPVTAPDVDLAYPDHVNGKVVVVDDEILALLRRYAETGETERGAKREREQIKALLRLRLGDAEAFVNEHGSPLLTGKTTTRAPHSVSASSFRQLRFTKWWTRLYPSPEPTEN